MKYTFFNAEKEYQMMNMNLTILCWLVILYTCLIYIDLIGEDKIIGLTEYALFFNYSTQHELHYTQMFTCILVNILFF